MAESYRRGIDFMREVYDLGPALAVACVSQDGRKDFQFARVQKLGVGVCTLQDKYGRMVPNVDRAPVEWWKTHYREVGVSDPVDSSDLIIVRNHGRVKITTGYTNGAVAEKGLEIYGAGSEDSFYRIMALRELWKEGLLPQDVSLNMFVLTPDDQNDEFLQLLMALPIMKVHEVV